MEELLIAAAVLAAVLYFGSSSTPSLLTSTPAPSPPSSALVSSDTGATSGGYQLTPQATNLANPGGYSQKLTAPNGLYIQSYVAPPPTPAASPAFWGGIAGTAFAGGNPFGGALRPGVSAGTGTTVVIPLLRPVAL
jgi:hypothetical protein